LIAEFPEAKENPYSLAYALLLIRIMNYISEKVLPKFPKDRLDLIHERGDYDSVLLAAFNEVTDNGTMKHRERFVSIASIGWEDCIPLQPADLIAYENFKLAKAKLEGKKKRISFEKILDLDSIGGRGATLPRDALKEIRKALDDKSKKTLFQIARIKAVRDSNPDLG
jgi:hypothetical protein